MKNRILLLIILIATGLNLQSKEIDYKSILKAMNEEMARSMKELQIDGLLKPYYLEYKITIKQPLSISSYMGKTTNITDDPVAQLSVDLRVGDYKFDNSNFVDLGFSFFGSTDDEESYSGRRIPLEINTNSLKRELWLATDAAYKQSNELYSKKLASIRNKTRKDTTEDFYPLAPMKNYDTTSLNDQNYINKVISFYDTQTLADKLSAIFKQYKEIYMSNVSIESMPEMVLYVNSEKREYIKSSYYVGLEAVTTTQAEDGLPINNYYTFFANNKDEFLANKDFEKEIHNLCKKTVDISKSKSLEDPYTGPVLFEGTAAGEVIAQNFAGNLASNRAAQSDGLSFGDGNAVNFQNKIGGRVLPEFMSVTSNPRMLKYENISLLGGYDVDDDGNNSQEIVLVKDGFLKTLLSNRVPTKRLKVSNGGRNGGGSMYSILKFDTKEEKQLSSKDLKSKLLSICKDRDLPFGIIVRKAMNQNIQATTLYKLLPDYSSLSMASPGTMIPIEIYKVFPDGKEEMFKSAKIKGISATSFKDILFTSNTKNVYKLLAPNSSNPFMSRGNPYITASIIAPDLLFEDIEVAPVDDDLPKPPYITKP